MPATQRKECVTGDDAAHVHQRLKDPTYTASAEASDLRATCPQVFAEAQAQPMSGSSPVLGTVPAAACTSNYQATAWQFSMSCSHAIGLGGTYS